MISKLFESPGSSGILTQGSECNYKIAAAGGETITNYTVLNDSQSYLDKSLETGQSYCV